MKKITILKGKEWGKRFPKAKRNTLIAVATTLFSLIFFLTVFSPVEVKEEKTYELWGTQDSLTEAYLYLGKLDARYKRLSTGGMKINGEQVLAYLIAKHGDNYTFDSKEVKKLYQAVYRSDMSDRKYIAKRCKKEGLKRKTAAKRYKKYQIFPSPFPGKPWTDRISSKWGFRIRPNYNKVAIHRGLDISMPSGTPISSVMEGTVKSISSMGDSLGNHVEIQYRDEKTDIRSLYAHMSTVSVKKGQKVHEGTIIGKVGSTGNSTGPHLHLELYYGDYNYDNEKQLLYPRIYLQE